MRHSVRIAATISVAMLFTLAPRSAHATPSEAIDAFNMIGASRLPDGSVFLEFDYLPQQPVPAASPAYSLGTTWTYAKAVLPAIQSRSDGDIARDRLFFAFEGENRHLDSTLVPPAQVMLPNQAAVPDLATLAADAYFEHWYSSQNAGIHTLRLEARAGSASDKLFHSGNEFLTEGAATLDIQLYDQGCSNLLVGAFYSNNRSLLNGAVLPGILYRKCWSYGEATNEHPPSYLTVIAGFPLTSVGYSDFGSWGFYGDYVFPRSASFWIYYQIGSVKLFLSTDLINQRYMRADRANTGDGILYQGTTLEAGIKLSNTLTLAAGRAYNQSFSEGDNGFSPSSGRLALADSTYFRGSLGF